MADIFFDIACKKLKIAQIAKKKLALSSFEFSSYIRPQLL